MRGCIFLFAEACAIFLFLMTKVHWLFVNFVFCKQLMMVKTRGRACKMEKTKRKSMQERFRGPL